MKEIRQKGQAIIWVLLGLAILLAIYLTLNNKPKTSSTTPDTKTELQPTSVTPTVSVTGSQNSDSQIDNQLNKINKDSMDLEKSLNDTPIDVSQ